MFMKYFLKLSLLPPLIFLASCVPPQQQPADYVDNDPGISYQEFYDGLSPYGHWIHHPSNGYVWVPEAGPNFVPYSTGGYWVWSDAYGWVWTSDYAWGWAPYHYGRWDNDQEYGWYWVPDLTWGPAWVAWREYPGYYGWAPMRPGISAEFAYGGGYMPPNYWWTGCEGQYFGRREMRDHFDRDHDGDRNHGERIGRIFGGESRSVGNAPSVGGGRRGLVTGPAKRVIEAQAHTTIPSVNIVRSNTPGEALSGNTLNIYRPELRRSGAQTTQNVGSSQTAAPRNVETPQTPAVRNNGTPPISTAPRNSNPAPPSATQSTQPVPRSVTNMNDVRDLRRQANPQNTKREMTPEQRNYYERPKENAPAPRQQAPPAQQAPRQQPAPRRSAPINNQPSQQRPK